MDIAAMIGAVTRRVRQDKRDGRTTRVVVAERDYATTIDDLWSALTDPDRILRWFMPIEGELRLSGHYQLTGNAGGEVLACDPPHSFAISWEYGGGASWVSVALEATGDETTRLTLEHVAHFDDIADFWDQYGPGATGVGWDLGLMGLAMHIEGGIDSAYTPQSEAEWSASDEGRRYIGGAVAGWVDAAIAFGDAENDSRAAGQRTLGFYTGDAAAGS